VLRLLRSIERLAPPIPSQEPNNKTKAQEDSATKAAEQESKKTTALVTPPSFASEGSESPPPGQPTPRDNQIDLLVATEPTSPAAATATDPLMGLGGRLQFMLEESRGLTYFMIHDRLLF
jgi:hypothetical protein